METQTERRLVLKMGERETVHRTLEQLLQDLDGAAPNDAQRDQITKIRSDLAFLDEEVAGLSEQAEADRLAAKKAQDIRRAANAAAGVADVDDDGVVYRTMAEYARDVILTGQGREVSKIGALVPKDERDAARQRLELMRTPANTLSSNVGGLIPPQHIAQIFQVIDTSRPLVESAGNRVPLDRGTVTYPVVTTPPVVAVQSAEKTEAGNTGMVIDMVTKTASTYLGGGDLSWQAINWSTPSALDMWFRLTAADYALKTETDAATIVSASAFLNNISSTLGATPTFAQFMTAVGAGIAEVYANSGRIADTVYMAPDRFGYMLGLTSDAFSQFVDVSQSGVGPLRVVVSRGLNSGEIIVGDRDGLLVAETPGAPVELRVVEPAIGGVEVGLIGAFEAAVVDDGAFALITTAS